MRNASWKVVSGRATWRSFSFGSTISVSTAGASSASPASARPARRAPSKPNGRVTTPTVSRPIARAARAITGAAPVPVPPPIPAVMKHIARPLRCSVSCLSDSSADWRPRSGRAPVPRPDVSAGPSCSLPGARLFASACESVFAATNSMLRGKSPSRIMLSIALPPAPPTPTTVISGSPAACAAATCAGVEMGASTTTGSEIDGGCVTSAVDSCETGTRRRAAPARARRESIGRRVDASGSSQQAMPSRV